MKTLRSTVHREQAVRQVGFDGHQRDRGPAEREPHRDEAQQQGEHFEAHVVAVRNGQAQHPVQDALLAFGRYTEHRDHRAECGDGREPDQEADVEVHVTAAGHDGEGREARDDAAADQPAVRGEFFRDELECQGIHLPRASR